MIRSLVANREQNNSEFSLRRNLELQKIRDSLGGCCMIWMDVVDPTSDEIEWLSETFLLNPAVVEDIKREDRRPALMVYPNYLFLSLFEPCVHLSRVSGREIHCIVSDNCFVTVRSAEAETVDDAYNRVAQNPAAFMSGIAYFLYVTSQFVVDSYYPLLDKISNQLNRLEEKLLNGGVKDSARKDVYRIKQQLIELRQMVAPQREVLSNVIGEKRLAENTDIRDLFRHLYERLLRVYDVIDSQRDLSSNVLDMMQNQESKTMIEAVNRLTIFSMIFLPLSFFSGLFELNFVSTSNPIVLPISGGIMFIFVVGAMVFSAGVMLYVFRRRGWL